MAERYKDTWTDKNGKTYRRRDPSVRSGQGELRSFNPPWYREVANRVIEATGANRYYAERIRQAVGPDNIFNAPAGLTRGLDQAARGARFGNKLQLFGGGLEAALNAIPIAAVAYRATGPILRAMPDNAVGVAGGKLAKGTTKRTKDKTPTEDIFPGDLPMSRDKGSAEIPFDMPALPKPSLVTREHVFSYRSHTGEQPQNPLMVQTPPYYAPPRGVPERAADLVANRSYQRQLGDLMDKGVAEHGNVVRDWYNTRPLYDAFGDVLGSSFQTKAAFERMMDAMAATSPQATVPRNITKGTSVYSSHARGEPLPESAKLWEAASGPADGTALNLARRLVYKDPAMKPFSDKDAPKVASFAANLKMDPSRTTIDAHATRISGMLSKDKRFLENDAREALERGQITMKDALGRSNAWISRLNETEYGAVAGVFEKVAAKRGLSGPQGQASAWYAAADRTGVKTEPLTFVGLFERKLRANAEQFGVTPVEMFRRVVKGETYLRAEPVSAVAAAASAAYAVANRNADKPGPKVRKADPVY